MEYIAGEDLKSLIKRAGQISVGKAIDLTQQILEGLVEAHRLGVVHRDLTSVNINREGTASVPGRDRISQLIPGIRIACDHSPN